MTVKEPISGNTEILTCIYRLSCKTITRQQRVRLVGVKLSGIEQPSVQADLFDPTRPVRAKRDNAVDAKHDRFGFGSIGAHGWTAPRRQTLPGHSFVHDIYVTCLLR